jgi:hypothetical protein
VPLEQIFAACAFQFYKTPFTKCGDFTRDALLKWQVPLKGQSGISLLLSASFYFYKIQLCL